MPTVLLVLLVAAASAEERTYDVEPARSTVRYHIVHKFHDVTGVSSTIEGKAVLKADGRILAMVRVPIVSFDSNERNRDAHMREAVDAGHHPFVVFRGVSQLDPQAAAARGAGVEARMDGEVDLRGVRRPVVVPLRIELSADGTARARGSFEVSLEAFGVERPSLLFVKIDDACRIDVDLALREAQR